MAIVFQAKVSFENANNHIWLTELGLKKPNKRFQRLPWVVFFLFFEVHQPRVQVKNTNVLIYASSLRKRWCCWTTIKIFAFNEKPFILLFSLKSSTLMTFLAAKPGVNRNTNTFDRFTMFHEKTNQIFSKLFINWKPFGDNK